MEIESPHPYGDNMNEYWPVSVPGASQLVVTFDERTRTERGCDYVTFFKNDHHNEYWGSEQQYSGCDGDLNFPGLNGNDPLVIPSDKFVVYFHSDGSNTDWGFKMTAVSTLVGVACLSCFTLRL